MQLRFASFCLLMLLCTSCEFFSFKKKSQLQEVDTIINYSAVDVSPKFDACKKLIDQEAISNCFRTRIYNFLSQSLTQHKIEVRKPIDEEVKVEVIIDRKGNVSVKRIIASDLVKETIQNFDSLVTISVAKLPKLSPAIKRGIPVTTQYQIPIRIQVK